MHHFEEIPQWPQGAPLIKKSTVQARSRSLRGLVSMFSLLAYSVLFGHTGVSFLQIIFSQCSLRLSSHFIFLFPGPQSILPCTVLLYSSIKWTFTFLHVPIALPFGCHYSNRFCSDSQQSLMCTQVDYMLFVGKDLTYTGLFPTRSLAHCFGHTKCSITII